MTTRLNRLMAHVPFLGLTARAPVAPQRGPGPDLALAGALPGLAVQPLGASLLASTAGLAAPAPVAAQPDAAVVVAPRAEESTEDEATKTKKSKKAETPEEEEEEDEQDREEMRGTTPAAAARARERARCLAIFGHPHAAANPALAASLAASRTGRHEARAILAAAPAAAATAAPQGELAAAMQGFAGIAPGADAPQAAKGRAGLEAIWDKAAVAAGVPAAQGRQVPAGATPSSFDAAAQRLGLGRR